MVENEMNKMELTSTDLPNWIGRPWSEIRAYTIPQYYPLVEDGVIRDFIDLDHDGISGKHYEGLQFDEQSEYYY